MNRFASSLACLSLLAPALRATPTIIYVGTESGTTVQNWSNPAVPKTKDLNGDDRFGGAGYYQITPGTVGNTWSDTAESGNNLGINALYPTRHETPSFITSVPSGGSGNYVNSDFYQQFVTPYSSETLRQGVLAVSIPEDVENEGTIPGGDPGRWCNAFTFTLSQNANFRLGIAVDTGTYMGPENPMDANNAPDFVSIYNEQTGEIFSTQPLSSPVSLNRNGVPDMVFFDITGSVNEVFSVRLWQTTGETGGPIAFALITFDQTPAPTLSYALNGDDITLSWEPEIPGWILESSTDLGVGDDWNPVPDANNDNSVTVPMTGVPNNFFRLRKNP